MDTPLEGVESLQEASPSAPSSGSRPALLPAFEPLPSPSSRPSSNSQKRKYDERDAAPKHYPTPIPTSSTGMLPSSPQLTRPGIIRAVSNISTLEERAPLGTVPSVDVPLSGEPVSIGRSANSSDYQLSANRLISRVHIRVMYLAPTPEHIHGEVLIRCLGWNGAKVHCKGDIFSLGKGDTFTSDRPEQQIIIDVLETRVLVAWPRRDMAEVRSGIASDEEEEFRARDDGIDVVEQENIASSPPLMPGRLRSPDSPSPLRQPAGTAASTFTGLDVPGIGADENIKVYEDHDSADDQPQSPSQSRITLQNSLRTETHDSPIKLSKSRLSESFEEHSDSNEENDPIVHSFYASGDNLLSRFESIKSNATSSPEQRRPRLMARSSPNSPQSEAMPSFARRVQASPIKNHVINQLAFSRVHSMPLSIIYNNLPNDLKSTASPTRSVSAKLTDSDLKSILDSTPCVGEISREGKDAAGKTLENEFYYVPEMDGDEMRRNAVVEGMGKPGLRAVRKQHKVCRLVRVTLFQTLADHNRSSSNITGSARDSEDLSCSS
ncbi:MAG: hypothetical protein M1820_005180 [Bogoriella megaspora]|nr:MAG: hypothetical protein M1820_005180 [Bogoriella megaspora]